MNNQIYYVGVDIGKTKIASGLFSEELLLIDRVEYPSGQSAQDILNTVEQSIEHYFFLQKTKICGIGIGTCGVVDPHKGVVLSSGTIKDWNRIPLGEYFLQRFKVPVSVENDVKTALYGEVMLSEDRKHGSFLYLSIGTSIGIAFMKDGFLLRGDNGRLGEVNRYLPRNSQYTLEQLIGGRGISQQYYDKMGLQKSCQELIFLASAGDPLATDIIHQFVISTADLIRWMTMCFDPSCVIIGGGVVCHNLDLFKMIEEQYIMDTKEYSSSLSLARFGVNSGIYGAAALAKHYKNEAKLYYC